MYQVHHLWDMLHPCVYILQSTLLQLEVEQQCAEIHQSKFYCSQCCWHRLHVCLCYRLIFSDDLCWVLELHKVQLLRRWYSFFLIKYYSSLWNLSPSGTHVMWQTICCVIMMHILLVFVYGSLRMCCRLHLFGHFIMIFQGISSFFFISL